jgi:hypothetical protein
MRLPDRGLSHVAESALGDVTNARTELRDFGRGALVLLFFSFFMATFRPLREG